MDRIIRYGAYAANILLIIAAGILIFESYGRDAYFAALLLIPPLLAIAAIVQGPDLEERRLESRVNKARLRRELAELEKGK